MTKTGTYRNPAEAVNGSLHVNAPVSGTIWIHVSGRGLLALDCYGDTPELVVYGEEPVKIRRAGSPLESALLYHPVSNRTRPVNPRI